MSRHLLRRSMLLLVLTVGMILAPAAAGKKPPPPAKGKHVLFVDDDKAQCSKAGFSTIQDAVNAAAAGARILVCAGTYHEAVEVSTAAKNGLKVVAKGAPGSVVMMGEMENPAFLAAFHLTDVSGVLIRGFTIREYHEAGILLGNPGMTTDGANGNRLRKNDISMSHHDGIALYGSSNNLIEHNYVHDNPSEVACGIQVGFTSAGNVVRHNRSVRNSFGIRLNDAASNNVVFRNKSNHNRRFGILNRTGANGTLIANNRTFFNTGTGAPPTEGRGIAVTSGSTGVKVLRNHAFFNTLDLFWDGSGSATFAKNHCKTSDPAGLCAHQEGK
jgi:parallel beta-helix repeat protein